jgi:hypothetical protein
VVLPVRNKLGFTRSILDQLAHQAVDTVLVFDHGSDHETADYLKQAHKHGMIHLTDATGWRFYEMWADGVRQALARTDTANIAFLNNDLLLSYRCLPILADALRADSQRWIVGARYDNRVWDGVMDVEHSFADGGIPGFCWMARLEPFAAARLSIDTGYHWWFGEDAVFRQCVTSGHTMGLVNDASVIHINGGSNTLKEVLGGRLDLSHPLLREDAERFAERFNVHVVGL